MRCQIERTIAAAPETVFAASCDFANAPRRISGIRKVEMLTDGPVRVGTRFRETRVMFGREAVEEMEVTEFEPGRRYVLGCENHGCRYRTEMRVEPAGAGTRLTMTFAAEPLTLFARIIGLLMRPLARTVVNACTKDMDDLKASLESGG